MQAMDMGQRARSGRPHVARKRRKKHFSSISSSTTSSKPKPCPLWEVPSPVPVRLRVPTGVVVVAVRFWSRPAVTADSAVVSSLVARAQPERLLCRRRVGRPVIN
uniref:(northern house mosquito) hypothetical protein n=1 Tax=Culex pipiens TaxID=7175 RepID=A0A8D8ABE1_CULPI